VSETRIAHEPTGAKPLSDRVRDVIAFSLDAPLDLVTDTARLVDDLAADSLDSVEIAMMLGDQLGVEIPDMGAAFATATVADVVRHVETTVAGCTPAPAVERAHKLVDERVHEYGTDLHRRFCGCSEARCAAGLIERIQDACEDLSFRTEDVAQAAPPEAPRAQIVDLMESLKASLAAKGKRS